MLPISVGIVPESSFERKPLLFVEFSKLESEG